MRGCNLEPGVTLSLPQGGSEDAHAIVQFQLPMCVCASACALGCGRAYACVRACVRVCVRVCVCVCNHLPSA